MESFSVLEPIDVFTCRRSWWIMEPAIRDGLVTERAQLSKRLSQEEHAAAREFQAALPDWCNPRGTLERCCAMSATLRQLLTPSSFLHLNKFVVVDLALQLEHKVSSRNLPAEILALYPAAASRLLSYVHNVSDFEYALPLHDLMPANDAFLKDLRFAAGLSVACASGAIDLRSAIGYRASARWILRNPSPRYARSVIRSGQVLPWCRHHTDSRYLEGFSEPGWDECYLQVAALMRLHPELLGFVGTSWFYDPQLEQVSPRLTYLRRRPLERGAHIVRSGTNAFDIHSATTRSDSRRRLYQQGKYTPVSYTLLWPREKIVAWADSQIGQHS